MVGGISLIWAIPIKILPGPARVSICCTALDFSFRPTAHEYRSFLCLLKTAEVGHGAGHHHSDLRDPGGGGAGDGE